MSTSDPHNFEGPKKVKLPPFNEIGGEASILALKKIHELARNQQVGYELTYNECANSWEARVTSAADVECLVTNDYILSSVLELVLDHLKKFYS